MKTTFFQQGQKIYIFRLTFKKCFTFFRMTHMLETLKEKSKQSTTKLKKVEKEENYKKIND